MRDFREEQLWLVQWHFLILVLNTVYMLHLQERCRVGDIEEMAGT